MPQPTEPVGYIFTVFGLADVSTPRPLLGNIPCPYPEVTLGSPVGWGGLFIGQRGHDVSARSLSI